MDSANQKCGPEPLSGAHQSIRSHHDLCVVDRDGPEVHHLFKGISVEWIRSWFATLSVACEVTWPSLTLLR